MKKLLEAYKELPIQVKASIVFLLCSFLQRGVNFITTPIFTRILTTTEYGQYTVFNSWLQIITPIVSLNLWSGVYSQGVVKFDKDKSVYSSSLQGLSLFLISLWLIIYITFRNQFNSFFAVNTIQMIAMFIIIWSSGSFHFWSVEQRVDFKYKKLAFLTVVVSIVQPLICIFLIVYSTNKVTARILGIAIVQLIFYLGTFTSQIKKGKKLFSKRYWIYALRFNIPLLPHYLSLVILSSSDRIMISNMVSNEKAGIYNLAYSISMIMTMFNTALQQTIEPWMFKKLKSNKIEEIKKVAYPCFLLVAFVNLLLILLAPEVISIFAPADYYEAVWVIPSVALSVFFMFLYSFFASFEFYYEKTHYVTLATVGGALLNVVLNYVCIKKFGYLAAGYTTLFSYILYAILHYIFMRKICKIFLNNTQPYNAFFIFIIGIGILIIGIGCTLLYKYPFIRYIILLSIIVLCYIFRRFLLKLIKLFTNIKMEKNKEN